MRSCVRWWLTVDSVRPSAAARSPLFSSLALDPKRNDMILTRADTELHVFEGKGHSLTIDSGWKDVAEVVLNWLNAKGF